MNNFLVIIIFALGLFTIILLSARTDIVGRFVSRIIRYGVQIELFIIIEIKKEICRKRVLRA